jgi:hypothetical protein
MSKARMSPKRLDIDVGSIGDPVCEEANSIDALRRHESPVRRLLEDESVCFDSTKSASGWSLPAMSARGRLLSFDSVASATSSVATAAVS